MARPTTKPHATRKASLPPLPLDRGHWQAIVAAIGLSPREAEVAELKIRGAQLKEMAALLGIAVTSVRGFQDRICAKAGIRRHEFFTYILGLSHRIRPDEAECSHS